MVNVGAVGGTLSIHVTVAVVDHVLPTASTNSNVNVLLPVNVCVSHPTLVIVIGSVAHINVAITSPLVALSGVNSTVAVGGVVSAVGTVIVKFQLEIITCLLAPNAKALPVHIVFAPTVIAVPPMTVPMKLTFVPRVVAAVIGVQNTSEADAPLVNVTLVLFTISSVPFILKI